MSVLKDETYRMNEKNLADGLDLLDHVKDESIATVFFDPQYKGMLDAMDYGNLGERMSGRVGLPQMDEDTIKEFLTKINRVLKKSGHLFLWLDKYHLVRGDALKWIEGTDLNLVDMITWDKQRMGMGYRSRCCGEYLVVFQKTPKRAKDCWTDRGIRDIWSEKYSRKEHPHTKPLGLQERLILATVKPGEVVCDPAAGSFSVLSACKECGRDFIGGDIRYGIPNEMN